MGDSIDQRLRKAFGASAGTEGPLAVSGAGLRITGIDLSAPLSPEQAAVLRDALAEYRIVTIAGQDLESFSLAHFERFANHWGAPLPHPSNTRQRSGAESWNRRHVEFLPLEERLAGQVNAAFPGQLQCLPHESPAVLVLANVRDVREAGERQTARQLFRGSSWHTDIESDPVPLWVSMFLVHKVPVARDAPGGTWVCDPQLEDPQTFPYFEDSDPELMRLRKRLPLNGETAYVDTAAAFAALPDAEQARLSSIRVRRRKVPGSDGLLAPLVRTNPRSGLKSLHSPLWVSRPRRGGPIDVEGMTPEESRAFLDRLEAHVLQPEFRYDHVHTPGDVTLWDLFMTLHVQPPTKENVESLDDVRLIYRMSCKGEPSLTLPRQDSPEWLDENIYLAYKTSREIIEAA